MTVGPDRQARSPFVEEHVGFVEERRRSTESVLWQLPSVSIAAQSFLLAAGLNPDATGWARILVGSLSMFAAVATGLVVVFLSVRLTVLNRWVQERLGEAVEAEGLYDDLNKQPLNRVHGAS